MPLFVVSSMTSPAPRTAILLACLTLAAPALLAGGEPDPSDSGRFAPLDPDLKKSIAALRSGLESLRGLRFESEVKTAAMSREAARAYIREILYREFPPPRLAAEEETYRYFGLLDSDRGLEEIYLDMLGMQVAGLYDPPRKTLFVIQGPLSGTMPLAHELAHALVDQHFDLDALQDRVIEDDDRALALMGLVEGDATMVTTLWMIRSAMDPNLPGLTVGTGDFAELLEAAEAGLEEVPLFVRETLLFPYSHGVAWAAEVMKRGGGLQALDPFYVRPPDSTEQILHPEKSLDPRDRISSIRPDLPAAGLPVPSRRIKASSMGEFGIRLLLGGSASDGAVRASEGWDGDWYLLAGDGSRRFMAWVSVWDSEPDAEEFREAIAAWLARRTDARAADPQAAGVVRRHGRIVIVAEGGSGEMPVADRVGAIAARLGEGIEIR